MSIVTVGFLAIMVLIGGVVALLADNLGRKIGKKRLKIHHKIRPRHTATLFVVGSGLLIPLLTVGLVSWLSKDVRTWLMEGEQAIADVRMLRPEVESLKTQKSLLTTDIDKLNTVVTRLQLDVKQANAQKQASENESKRLEETKKKLDTQVSGLKSRIDSIAAKSKVEAAKLARASFELDKTERELGRALPALRELMKQRDEAYQEIADLNRDLTNLEQTKGNLDRQITALQNSKDQIQREYDQQKIDLATKQKELDDKRKELSDAEAELKRVTERIGDFIALNNTTRNRRLIFALGDEVARIVVNEDLTTTQARNQLNSLIRSARVSAESVGAKRTGIGGAGLFDQQMDGRTITAEQQMNQYVAQVAGVPQSRIIVAKSIWNSYVDEPVALEIFVYPNKLSFNSGDVISEVKIDGDLSWGQVIAMLSNWLAVDVKAAALKAGMVPVAGRADTLASVAPEDIIDLVNQIKSQSRTARVQALAFDNTYAAGPLKLAFRIR